MSTRLSGRWERFLDWTRRRPAASDAALALCMSVLMAVSVVLGYWSQQTSEPHIRPWSMPLAVVAMVPFAFRRRWPEAHFLVMTTAYMVAVVGNVPDDLLGLIAIWVALYSVGVYGGRFRTVVRAIGVTGIVVLFVLWLLTATADSPSDTRGPAVVYSVGIALGLLCTAWLFGDTMRIRRQQADDLARRAAELELERDRNAAQAVTEERLRIARELHDVLAHHVTVIGVQAAAAERVLDRDPAHARGALGSIADASRETVDELQRLLGFLRSDSEQGGDPRPPQPALTDLARLVGDSVMLGLDVELSADGDLAALPGSVSLSGYRIVQEALTNVRRHARGARTTVEVAARNGVVRIGVTNGPGTGGAVPFSSTGHGIVGMRERARLVGGDLTFGPRPDGGWHVSAVLPTTAVPIP